MFDKNLLEQETKNLEEAKRLVQLTQERTAKELKHRARLQGLLTYVSLTLGVAGAIAASFAFSLFSKPADTKITAEQLNKIDAIEITLVATKRDLETIQHRLDALAKSPEQSATSIQLNDLSSSIAETHTKVSNLEKAIMDNPTKALELPLLKKDLEALKEGSKSELLTTRQEIERIYDLNKWFLGLMITSLLAIIGLAISSLFKKGGGTSPA